ncbi:unnamed protein product [Closterium sp. Yama58-4]|nr:unnamed protein product [Closterium sp. Yama58-4]
MSLPQPISAFDGDDVSTLHDLVAVPSPMAHGRHSEWKDTDFLAARHRASQNVAAAQCSLTGDLTNSHSLSCDSIPILEPESRPPIASRILERRASERNRFPRDDYFTSRGAIASTSENTANVATATKKIASRGREFVRSLSEFPPSLHLGSGGTNSTCSGPTSVLRVGGTGGYAIADFHIDYSGQLSAKDDSDAATSLVDRLDLFPDPEPILFLLPDGSVRFFCRGARDPLLRVADVMREYPGLHVGVASGSRASLSLDPASVLLSAPSATYFLHPPHPAASTRSGIARGMSTKIAAAGSGGWIAADNSAARGSGSVGDGAAFCGALEDADRMIRGIELQLDRFERRLRREFSVGIAPAAAGTAATAAACSDCTASATRSSNDESDSESFLMAAAAAVSQPFSAECNNIARESALSLSGPLPFAAYPARSSSLALNPSPLPLSPPESPRAASARPPPRLHLAPATPPLAPTPASPSSPRLSARSRTEPRNSNRNRNRYGDRDALTGDPSPIATSRRSNTGGRHYFGNPGSASSSESGRRGSSVYPRSSSSPSSSSPPTSSPSPPFSCATPASSHSHSLWRGASSSSNSSLLSSSSSSSSSIALSRPSSCSCAGASSGFSSFASSTSSTSTSPLPTSSPFSLKSASFSSFSSSLNSRINRHHSKSADSNESSSSYSNPTSVVDLTSDVSTGTGRFFSSINSSGGGGSGGTGGGSVTGGRITSCKLWPACLTPPRTRGDYSAPYEGQAHEHTARRHCTRKAPLHHRSRSISFLCGSSSGGGGSGGSIAEDDVDTAVGISSVMASPHQAVPAQTRASQQRRKPKTKASRSDSELFNDAAFEAQFCEVEQGELDSGVESQDEGNGGVIMACGPVYPLSPLWRPSGQHGIR